MKRLLYFFLCVFFLMALSACDPNREEAGNTAATNTVTPESTAAPENTATDEGTEPETTEPPETLKGLPAFQALIAEYVDLDLYDDPFIDDNSCDYSLKDKADPQNFPKNGYIVVGNGVKVYTNETLVSELLSQGWTFAAKITDDTKIAANITVSGHTLTQGDHEILVVLVNDTDETVHITEAKVASVILEQYGSGDKFTNKLASATDFLLDGKISQDSGIQDILELYGAPWEVSYVEQHGYSYIRLSYGVFLSFQISADGSTVFQVSCY